MLLSDYEQKKSEGYRALIALQRQKRKLCSLSPSLDNIIAVGYVGLQVEETLNSLLDLEEVMHS